MNDQCIHLVGVKNAKTIDAYFASSMVDVAYIVEISNDIVKIVPDTGIDLGKRDDVEWVTGQLTRALSDCDEMQAAIEIYAGDAKQTRP